MPARIIETSQQEFAAHRVDPVTLDIIENALRNARVEMDATLFRTALSPGIREQGDAFPLIAERHGKMVVGQFGSFIDGFFAQLRWRDRGRGHHPSERPLLGGRCDQPQQRRAGDRADLSQRPADRMVGHVRHMTDVGGRVPGSLPTNAGSIFEEGLRIPPVKLYRRGALQEDIIKITAHQSRMPEWFKADLHAIVAACRVGGRRVVELCDRFGDDMVAAAMQELLERNRRAMAHLIATAIGESPVSFEDYICDDGRGAGPFRIKCTMWREGEKVILDFAGTDPQSASSINFYLNENMFKMFFGIYMVMVFDPQVMFNDGFYDLVDVRIPAGSLLKPRFPAALSCRTHALGRIFDVLGALLGQKTPEFLCAAGFSSSPHLMFSGHDQNGKWFQLFQIGFGGIPGRPFGDGADGHSLWPGFTNVPNEFLERYFPMVIERYESVADSGGAGKFRGGNGIHMTYRFTQAGKIAIHDDRWFVPPWGVNGGKPGKRSWKQLVPVTGEPRMLPSKCDDIDVQPGDTLHFVTWGGGGWGNPFDRDPVLVALEVQRGLVTEAGAREYGVVCTAQGVLDIAATTQLRAELSRGRDGSLVFDRGPSIEALRARCLEETGLPAPVQPVWRHFAAQEPVAA